VGELLSGRARRQKERGVSAADAEDAHRPVVGQGAEECGESSGGGGLPLNEVLPQLGFGRGVGHRVLLVGAAPVWGGHEVGQGRAAALIARATARARVRWVGWVALPSAR